tara:strand:- start:902 stop:1030 length:129 start_codon:yes stop_codon:yes gene_type:complete
MPYGKGTYGSKVGRPKKKKTSKKKKKGSTKKKKTKINVGYYG